MRCTRARRQRLEYPLDDDEQEDNAQAKDEPFGLLLLHGVIDPHIAVDLHSYRQERCQNYRDTRDEGRGDGE